MPIYFIIIPVLIPFLFGALLFVIPFRKRTSRNYYVMGVTCLNTLFVLLLLFNQPSESLKIFQFARGFEITMHIDSMGCLFAGLVSLLWPLADLYAFEYMKHEEREGSFFAFYTMTYGAVVGISFAGNLLTMYVFYELLTLVTFPLVMHTFSRKAITASRKYLYYSLGGAAFAFLGIIFVSAYGSSMDFTAGGVMKEAMAGSKQQLLLLIYVITFCGFSVKAALVPFHFWLIGASVAPTPVTALLHAVAVVKAGAFAVIRLSYYIFGADALHGTWAQMVVMLLTMVTILYGSGMAVKETHFKRRLAYSTISNLSYILLGVTMFHPLGLLGALTHMVVHAVTKICSFFCAGAVMYKTNRNYINELRGLGRKMPLVFGCFIVAALSLIGIPPLAGFLSKWNLSKAALEVGTPLSYLAVGVLLLSAFFTAIYMLQIVVTAYLPCKDYTLPPLDEVRDPGWQMKLPLILFCIVIIGIGFNASWLMEYLEQIVQGAYLGL